MIAFISGVLVTGYMVAALFFLRFWRRTQDRLFMLFAVAFALLAVQRGLLALFPAPALAMPLYVGRLTAFSLILVAIWDKNRPRTQQP